MVIKGLVDVDFIQYKEPSMFIIFPYCDFKCDKEAGCSICQNSGLANEPNIDIDIKEIVSAEIKSKVRIKGYQSDSGINYIEPTSYSVRFTLSDGYVFDCHSTS